MYTDRKEKNSKSINAYVGPHSNTLRQAHGPSPLS